MLWAAVAAGACLVAPASASAGAAEFFASPGGVPTAACTEADPCDIRTAVDSASSGQSVRLLGGEYELGNVDLSLNDGQDVFADDPSQPVGLNFDDPANSSSSPAVYVGPDARLADVTVTSDFLLGAVRIRGVVDRVTAVSTRDATINQGDSFTIACSVNLGTIRDSLCLQTENGSAIGYSPFGGYTGGTVRGVTAASAAGSAFAVVPYTGDIEFDIRNSILLGGYASQTSIPDVEIETGDNTSTADVDIDFSNFDLVSVNGNGSTDFEVSQPGSGSNQTAAPLFADLAGGDFHQAAGSPTIDAGDGSASDLGSLDLDRTARVQGDSIDIGAYETAGPPDPDTTKPTVKITKGPAKKTRARNATFRFTGSDDMGPVLFSCRLDGKPARPCSSPTTYRNLKPGRHSFALTGSDDAGNKTTKRYAWKVVKKKRRG